MERTHQLKFLMLPVLTESAARSALYPLYDPYSCGTKEKEKESQQNLEMMKTQEKQQRKCDQYAFFGKDIQLQALKTEIWDPLWPF